MLLVQKEDPMDCFDRNRESKTLWRHFRAGRNVLMLAPRRVGKTVLLNRLKDEGEGKGFHAIVLDVEGHRSEKAFFQQMCAAIQEEIGLGQAIVTGLTDRLKRLVHGAETSSDWRQILLSTDWLTFANHLLAHLEAQEDRKPWLFLVDEMPIFVKGLLEGAEPTKAQDFLYTLRNLQRQHASVRWLYTGSIGLDTVARRYNLEGALVDMEVVPLEPFDSDTARAFLNHVARRSRRLFTPEAAGAAIERLGWLAPYYLEKLAEAACERGSSTSKLKAEDVHRAADSLLELSRRTYWATWREHLEKNFPEPEKTHLFTILSVVSADHEGATLDSLLIALNSASQGVGELQLRGYLDTLTADGYLTATGETSRLAFRMNLLREWWVRYVASPRTSEEPAHG
jgi:hypothetical protein